jgi:hypothetical protein
MEEVFLRILGGDEAEAAIGDDFLDRTGGHSQDLLTLPERGLRDARSVREEGVTTRRTATRCGGTANGSTAPPEPSRRPDP